MTKVAILGYGTVGSGVYEVISTNERNSQYMQVKHILDIREFPELPHAHLFTKNFEDILNDSEVEIIAEVMGGLHPAYEFTKQALMAGKHVVTSNKELVATHGAELLKIAREHDINYMFEASVGGGIPIIRPLNQCLAANEIYEILGILNGTTNYILTQMVKAGKSFETALSDAQEKGYAERNPDADILGYDACRKIAILASLACQKHVNYEEIHTEGITEISLDDVSLAGKMGYAIKLVGLFQRLADEKVLVRVSPMLLLEDHPLAGVEDVFNGIFVKGDAIGDVMFYGRGAGKLPTASAVVADMIDSCRNIDRNKPLVWNVVSDSFVMDYKEAEVSYFVRLQNTEETKESIRAVFGKVSMTEQGEQLAFRTPVGKDGELCDRIGQLPGVLAKIRVWNQD